MAKTVGILDDGYCLLEAVLHVDGGEDCAQGGPPLCTSMFTAHGSMDTEKICCACYWLQNRKPSEGHLPSSIDHEEMCSKLFISC